MMRIASFFVCVLTVAMIGCTAQGEQSKTSRNQEDHPVDDIMSKMSIEEKIGQMTQLTLDMICVGEPYNLEEPHRIDEAKLSLVFDSLHVGSILNCGGHSYDRQKWLDFHTAIKNKTDETELQIPVLYGIDAIHGVTYTDSSVMFPQQIAQACMWNPELVKRGAEITAYEMRASGIRWDFSPVLDIARDPRWPRFWETYGEDPYYASVLGVNTVEGYQGDSIGHDHGAACLKHFLGYSQTLSGKDRTPAWLSERQIREYFLPSFEAAIDAGAMSIMINSGEINGIPVHTDPNILIDLLRDELGFEGLVVSDWEDIKYLVSRHKVAADYKEAIEMSINAGVDMSMVPVDYDFPVLLKELVDEGRVSEARINEACRRVLMMKWDLGLFDAAVPTLSDYPRFKSEEHVIAAQEAAEESIVLVKNGGVLPLSREKRYVLAGPNSADLNALNGGWTRTWQGDDPKFNTPGCRNLLEEFEFQGVKFKNAGEYPVNLNQYKSGYDAIILALGEKPYTETPGDIEHLDLDFKQQELLRSARETGLPVIVVLIEGRPRTFDQPEHMDACLIAMLPGDYGAAAITNILFGDVNPSGKLAFTYPRYASAHTCYDHKYTDLIDPNFGTNAVNPLFEFGHGMSYTTFNYADLQLNQTAFSTTDTLRLHIDVSNTGELTGKEVVHVYVSDLVATITPSVKRLRAFDKVQIEAGKTESLTFEIPIKDLSFVGRDLNWVVEPGEFVITIGDQSQKFEVK